MEKSLSRIASVILILAAIALIIAALVGSGNQMWTAAAGAACAFGAAAIWSVGKRSGGAR